MTHDLKSDRLRARIAKLMDRVGADDGDERFRRAAGVLRGKRAGRRPVADTEALAFVKKLVDAGLSKNSACREAAVRYEPKELAIDAAKARLFKKFTKLIN